MADTKTEKTVADELKTAAATLREMAKGDPWAISTLVQAEVGEPLASWLEKTAEDFRLDVRVQDDGGYHSACDGVVGEDCICFFDALAVARVVNGTAS